MGLFIKKNNQLVPVGISAEVVDGTDVSDTTAVAADVASGKYFYLANGTKAQGTASTYNGEYHVIIPYNVSISLTNPYDPEYFDSCEIYQINSTHLDETNTYDDITIIGTITSPTGSITVQVSDSAFCMGIAFAGTGMGVGVASADITGDILEKRYPDATIPPYPGLGHTDAYFVVSGDGTIVLDRVEWDDD